MSLKRLWLLLFCTGPVLYWFVFYSPDETMLIPVESCNCYRRVSPRKVPLNRNFESTCGDEATALGEGQKVISFSIYARHAEDVPRYVTGFKPNLDIIPKLYPGWVVRVYSDLPRIEWCELLCQHDFLYLCDVTNLPGLGNLISSHGMTWRFLPIGDPLVDIFLSRDSDSILYPRDRAAVQEWETSNLIIHAMRDHPLHGEPLMGGMWGAKPTRLAVERRNSLHLRLVKEAKNSHAKEYDQKILKEIIYKELSNETMAHDSYACGRFPDAVTLAFPTKRVGGQFVGNVLNFTMETLKNCPVKCRRHSDWTVC